MKKQYTKIVTAYGFELYTVKKMSRGMGGKTKYQYDLNMYTLINRVGAAKLDHIKDIFGIKTRDERGHIRHTCKNKDDAMQKLTMLKLMGLYE